MVAEQYLRGVPHLYRGGTLVESLLVLDQNGGSACSSDVTGFVGARVAENLPGVVRGTCLLNVVNRHRHGATAFGAVDLNARYGAPLANGLDNGLDLAVIK
ncbi:hypothetical protein [Rhizobium mesoamericanum]|uniref:hypothetical protein n=1 Tax=Rhizobium mesoamericanum TaxID=1079800 RepID=UPI00056609E2|nr:hypothetical protein [Rhizobium mesoamericanum]